MTEKEIERALYKMPLAWAMRWCQSGLCACLGCANNSGGLRAAGVTRDQWAKALTQMTANATGMADTSSAAKPPEVT